MISAFLLSYAEHHERFMKLPTEMEICISSPETKISANKVENIRDYTLQNLYLCANENVRNLENHLPMVEITAQV